VTGIKEDAVMEPLLAETEIEPVLAVAEDDA
jgi:hypothetical protein